NDLGRSYLKPGSRLPWAARAPMRAHRAAGGLEPAARRELAAGAPPAGGLRPAPVRRHKRPAPRAASWSRTEIHHTAQTHGHTDTRRMNSTTAHDGVRSRDLRDTSVSGTWVTLRRVTMIIL